MRSLLFLPALLALSAVHATDYYISPNGNDANNGTSPATAWRTLERANQNTYQLQPGDRILLEKGGVWRGELALGSSGTQGQPITVGSYGSGAKPVIKGSDVVTGWTVHQGNIWKAPIAGVGAVPQVYVNGRRMTLARYPNVGWLRNNQGGGNQIQSNGLTQPNGYWNGATAVVRGSNWSFDTLRVSGYSQGTLQFTSGVGYLENNPWGFFLRGKLSELDSPGEWYYDKAAGMLYLWAPDNANPNNLLVEAAVHNSGVNCYWQRSWFVIQDLEFRHQRLAGVANEGASRVTVTGCTFRDLYHAIRSPSSNNVYKNNTIRDTYATALLCFGSDNLIEGNTLTSIAVLDGEGENNWGYFGIRMDGQNNTIRLNRLDSVGYIGISCPSSGLVERNVVRRAMVALNDGGGIAMDHTDGLVVQDNIVEDPIGRLDNGVAQSPGYYENMTMGIYFGNTAITNTVVQRNTVHGCHGAGIHVDHTMVTSGVQVKDNILFNNNVQLSISDYSNNVGQGATPPYYVANYNDVYSGNVMYSLTKDQYCMRQLNVYGANPVDFGTFSNNRYFNPYNEMSISVMNFVSGQPSEYTLERWQAERGEDAGSTRSPMRLAEYATLQELTGNLVQNGDFTNHVNGWTGWPTNAQVSRVTNYLDNGALKAYLPNNSMYPNFTLRNPDPFPLQNGAWYRVKCSVQSDTHGELVVRAKGESTVNDPYSIWERTIPFSPERRDLVMYFKSSLTDQSRIEFRNQWTEPLYYLDNVEVTRVNVQALDPLERHKLLVNDQEQAQSFALPAGCWRDIEGNFVQGSISVPPMSSRVIYMDDGPECNAVVPSGGVKVKMRLAGATRPGATLMADDLRQHGLLPNREPYTAMGYTLENAGATANAAVLQATGANAVVDWVLVQLHANNQSYAVQGTRAALLLRNGTVIGHDGNPMVVFNSAVAGRLVSVHHRNHLATLATAPISSAGVLLDFTSANLPLYGTNAQAVVDQAKALWAGDVQHNGAVKYTGAGNDRDAVLQAIGGLEPTNVVAGYHMEDVNLDGFVSYTGIGNDRELILGTLGGSNGTAVKVAAMP